ncbi:UNVERIFIED_CONTAM: hypothetical protein FKN15_010485 [Acipenser sinensis]
MNSGLPASAGPLGGICIPGVKLKYCRYYAKDKTCFYGDECQFLHEEPSMAGLAHHASGSPVPLSMVGGQLGAAAGYPHAGAGTAGAGGGGGTKKIEPLGAAGVGLEGQLLAIPGMDGGALAEASLTNSYFSSSFIGVNGFGSPAEPKYSMMQVFPQYHVYPPTAPHVAYMQPKANAPSFFMSDELRQELINRHLITMAQIDQSENPGVPTEVDNYHSLFPLESLPPPNRLQKTSNFSYVTSCYKAVNSKDDLPYCLRRIHGFRLVNTKCMVLVDMWKKIQHSNFVTLREVFTTKAFGEHSLVFAYDFHAGAETMFSRHFNDPSADSYFTKRKWAGQHDGPLPRQHAGLLPESLIWAYIVQLSSALRSIHTAGLACRVMDPTKILITGKTRLRVNCVGIFDVLTFDNSQTNPLALMAQYQQADLISLGKVVLALACNSLAGIQRENLQKAMELVSINYSSDLKNLILLSQRFVYFSSAGQHDGPLPRQHAGLLPESLIWAYIVQLSSALRSIHTAGLACRVMDPTKILITGKTRLRVNCVGIFDVLTFDNSQTNPLALMAQYQQADLISLGKVVLALACNSLAGIQRENLQKAMELVSINYSSDLKNLILYLLTEQNRLRSVNDIMPMIGARFYTQLDASQMRNDVIEEDLAKEVQNGRLFRLLAKLGTINERPEFQKDPTWSETGDRYLLKLFRDHLFHQVTEAGTPWIDLSHIVSCLNKLDSGVPEKISLVSRDEKSILVVTYADLKRCFESTFQELQAAANGQL